MIPGRINRAVTRSKHSIVADRVVFLQSGVGAGAEVAEGTDEMTDLAPARPSTISAPLEKEIMDQIEAIKNRPKVTKTTRQKRGYP